MFNFLWPYIFLPKIIWFLRRPLTNAFSIVISFLLLVILWYCSFIWNIKRNFCKIKQYSNCPLANMHFTHNHGIHIVARPPKSILTKGCRRFLYTGLHSDCMHTHPGRHSQIPRCKSGKLPLAEAIRLILKLRSILSKQTIKISFDFVL